jgi:HTH-type transcriptional regulator/antitoxin HigA
MSNETKQIIEHWKAIHKFVKTPLNDKECEGLIKDIDKLMSYRTDNGTMVLAGLINLMSQSIKDYLAQKFESDNKERIPGKVLKYYMGVYNLKQSDLAEIGSQGVISELVNGNRELTLGHIKKLSKRFNVSPITFIEV